MQHFKATFQELKSTLDRLDQEAVRNKKLDFEIFPTDALDRKLQELTKHEKRKLMLTQIGYLRINLFQEYYERIQAAQERKDLNKAIQLMQRYIQTIALPFIQERLHPSFLTRISNLFSVGTLPDATQTLREWQTRYRKWDEQRETESVADQIAPEEFERMKKTFITLYTLSFSPSNFPPVAVEPSH